MLGELIAVIALAGLAVFQVAILVARFAYQGSCPRCGRAIRRGQLACSRCGCCHSGPGAGLTTPQ